MPNIRQRIHAVMKELQGVELVNKPGVKFKMVLHDDVTAALRPLYIKHGIDQEVSVVESIDLPGGTTQLKVQVAWVNIDEPEDRKVVFSYGHATPAKQGPDMRRDDLGIGKALSYAVKSVQLKNFALLSGDEDLEQQASSKPEPTKTAASVAEVEAVMNQLHAVETKEQFVVAARACGDLAGRITPEQNKIMGAAWLAAKQRSESGEGKAPLPPELGGEEPPKREQSTAEKIAGTPGEGLTAGEMQELMHEYKNVRTKADFAAIRVKMGKVLKGCTPAQKQVLAECDGSADRLLRAQEEAAR